LLGDHVELGHGVVIRENTKIGSRSRVGTGTIIDGGVTIGEDVSIQSGVYIPPRVVIGNRVFIAPRVTFTNDRYPPSRRLIETIIEDEAVIGAGAVIVAGIRIGYRSVVGAGAVVTKDVPPETVVIGAPARPVMSRSEYEYKKHKYEEGLSTLKRDKGSHSGI